jgi:hypothetical protein
MELAGRGRSAIIREVTWFSVMKSRLFNLRKPVSVVVSQSLARTDCRPPAPSLAPAVGPRKPGSALPLMNDRTAAFCFINPQAIEQNT